MKKLLFYFNGFYSKCQTVSYYWRKQQCRDPAGFSVAVSVQMAVGVGLDLLRYHLLILNMHCVYACIHPPEHKQGFSIEGFL